MRKIWRVMVMSIVAGAFFLAPAPMFGEGVLNPSVALPELSTISAADYYPLLLEWTKSIKINAMTLLVSYLDPKITMAQIKNEETDAETQKKMTKEMLGKFPQELRIRVIYRSPERAALHIDEWHLELVNGKGQKASPLRSEVVSPLQLQTGASGQWWEESIAYSFPNMDGSFLPPKAGALGVNLSGPHSNDAVTWQFNADAEKNVAADESHYIVILGWVSIAICLILLYGLWKIRAPSGVI
jgi:hypothetical protein